MEQDPGENPIRPVAEIGDGDTLRVVDTSQTYL
jgi:endonuclease YncB( thermonuclease family)